MMLQKILLTFPNYQFIRTKLRQWNTFKMTEYVSCFPWIKTVSFLREENFEEFMIIVLYFKVKCQDPNDASKDFY